MLRPAGAEHAPAHLVPAQLGVLDIFEQDFLGTFDAVHTMLTPPGDARLWRVWRTRPYPWCMGCDRHLSEGAFAVKACAWDASSASLTLTLRALTCETTLLRVLLPSPWRPAQPPVTPFRVSIFVARTLHATGQSRVTLSLRQEHAREACGPQQEESGLKRRPAISYRRPTVPTFAQGLRVMRVAKSLCVCTLAVAPADAAAPAATPPTVTLRLEFESAGA